MLSVKNAATCRQWKCFVLLSRCIVVFKSAPEELPSCLLPYRDLLRNRGTFAASASAITQHERRFDVYVETILIDLPSKQHALGHSEFTIFVFMISLYRTGPAALLV